MKPNDTDTAFLAKLMATFKIEAEEHIKVLASRLLSLEQAKSEERAALLEVIFREAHSLKGAARSVNQKEIQIVCQSLENVLAACKKEEISLDKNFFDILYATVKTLEESLAIPLEKPKASALAEQLDKLVASSPPPPNPAPLSLPKPIPLSTPAPISTPGPSQVHGNLPAKDLPAPSARVASQEISKDKTIRISLTKIDRLFQEAEELLMVKLAAQEQGSALKNLIEKEIFKDRDQLITPSEHFCPVSKSPNNRDKLGEIKAQLEELAQSAEQHIHFVSSLIDAHLDGMKGILMQPISTLFDSLAFMVRDIAHSLQKEVVAEMSGGDIEIDRRILEEIKDPLVHLIRNAIDHGIEMPAERQGLGKALPAHLTLSAVESGGSIVEITIGDDGKGIDAAKVKSVAIEQGLLSAQEAESMRDDEAYKWIFYSGISTASTVTELSGRGLGLSIVAEKVDRMGGKVTVESKKGFGTIFHLFLPLTLATFRGIHCTAGSQEFIIPTLNVIKVLKCPPYAIESLEGRLSISLNDNRLPFIPLSQTLDMTPLAIHAGDRALVVVIKALEQTIALGVDQIHCEREVLVKPLGTICQHLVHMRAATILEGGKVVPILDPSDVVKTALSSAAPLPSPLSPELSDARQPAILLAEDSITTRLLMVNILENAGYTVIPAVDGVEALELLQGHRVDLLLTDIEMPRMDGFKLAEKVRGLPNFSELPIVICTSRASQADRERGVELRANAYIDKSHFSQESLLNILQSLL